MASLKIAIAIVMLAICSMPALAVFDVFLSPENNTIYLNQYATFEITLVNGEDFSDHIQVSTIDPYWIVMNPSSISVGPKETVTETLILKPKSGVFIGPHGVTLKFKSSRTGKLKQSTEVVTIVPFDPRRWDYVPNIALGVDIDNEIDPRQKIKVDLLLRNRNNQDEKNITVRVYSDLFEEEYLMDIGALQEKTNTLLFEIDHLETPGVHTLHVWVLVDGVSISEVTRPFEVMDYSNILEKTSSSGSFFKSVTTVTFKNIGNRENTKQYLVLSNPIIRIFQKTDPDAEVVSQQGRSYLVWDVELDPLEERTIVVEENYRVLFYMISAAVIILVLYYILRSPVLIRKDAKVLKHSDEGALEIKVILYLRNRSRKKISAVRIFDRLSPITALIEDKNLGMLKPDSIIRHSKKGTLLKWEITNLEPYEERIISYKVRTKLGIVGGIFLRSARARFDPGNGKERLVRSRNLDLKL